MPKGANLVRVCLLLLIIVAMALFFASGSQHYLTLDVLQAQRAALADIYAAHPLAVLGGFFALYVAVTALSLPGAGLLTLAAGALFGLASGLVLVSFASSIGATLAFLGSRFVFRAAVERRFGDRLAAINRGVDKEGVLYLFTLRLLPFIPFFLINLLMGLTALRTRTFYWVSQLGMLAGSALYVNAGTQLGELHSLAGILSPKLIGSSLLLGVFPLIARWIINAVKARRVYRKWQRPQHYDRNLVVIGAGSAGLVSAYISATVRAKVTLVEGHKMGGDCLNYGCVPSKALIRTSRLLANIKRAREFGLHETHAELDFAAVMARVQRVIGTIEPHDSVERYAALGVDVRCGHARITTPWTVEIDGKPITTRAIVIAAGAEPFVPPIPGLAEAGYLTSDTLWELRKLPQRMLILGGGPIGCELAQAFARLGSTVSQVEMLPHLLLREDDDVSDQVRARLEADGVRVLVEHKAVRVETAAGDKTLIAEHAGAEVRLPFDTILVALGRKPRISGYGLEELGMPLTKTHTVETNDYLQTLYPNIYACGDVAGPYQFTHVAAYQAWYAAVNALFGRLWKFRIDYTVIPAVTFTDPEVARVGINEREARERHIAYEVTRYGLDDLDRAVTDEAAHGFVKVLTVPGKDRILGATIVGEHAGELLAEFVLAMRHRLGLNKILGTIHAYPTWAEANKYAAGAWKKAHAPERALRWLARYLAWQRR